MTPASISGPAYPVAGGYFIIALWICFYFKNRLVAVKAYFAAGT